MTLRWKRSMWCLLVMLVTGVAATAAPAQLVFPGGTDNVVPNDRPFKFGQPMIIDASGRTICRYELNFAVGVPSGIYRVGFFPYGPFDPGIFVRFVDGTNHTYTFDLDRDFTKNCDPPYGLLLETLQPSTKAAPVPIAVSNSGDTFAVTCDGHFSVVAGSPLNNQPPASSKPVSLIDNPRGVEVAAIALPNKLARAVAIGDDGHTVVAVIDDAVNTIAGSVRRLVLSPAGTLTDSGQEVGFSGAFVRKVEIAPGSKFGVVLVDQTSTNASLVSFSLPGLAVIDSATLSGRLGHAVVFGPTGNKAYVRSGGSGVDADGDVIEGFDFDPVTGRIVHTPGLRIGGVSTFYGTTLHYPLSISADGTLLVATEGNDRSKVPPRITLFDSTSGAIVNTFTGGGWTPQSPPKTLGGIRSCAHVTVVEYYNASLDHYFITWLRAEQANLDAGNTPTRWTRTGNAFSTYIAAQPAASPVCRFYIPPLLGDSHFFGRGVAECNATGQKNPTFTLEDAAFMQMYLPVAGACPVGTTPVYRVFDNRADANHRYMIDRALRTQMVLQGWIAEGDGPDLVVMCAPQ
jgi:hypothetical protein